MLRVSDLIFRTGSFGAEEALHVSERALDAPLEGDAELSVVTLRTEATVLGAFQRPTGLGAGARAGTVLRRISGGPSITVGAGTLHVLLALAHPSVLVPCDPARLMNRYVRPLLHALTKTGALAHYFGRDWVSVAHRPVAQVGFAHDSTSGRAVFEAFVAVETPFAAPGRASLLGKEPGTLASVVGQAFDVGVLAERIAIAYAKAGDRAVRMAALGVARAHPVPMDDPPWTATADEAIGEVGAGRDASGTLRLGGDLLASRDALGRVAAAVSALQAPDAGAIGRIVNEELRSPRVALQGVKDLGSLEKVLREAWSG